MIDIIVVQQAQVWGRFRIRGLPCIPNCVGGFIDGHCRCKIRWQAYGQMEGFQRLCSLGIKHDEGYITQPGIVLICPDSSTIECVAVVHFPTSFDFELRMYLCVLEWPRSPITLKYIGRHVGAGKTLIAFHGLKNCSPRKTTGT